MSNEVLPVIFRAEKSGQFAGSVSAVFPTEPGTPEPGTMACYARIGQHGSCHIGWYRERTRPATPDEYAPLLAELRDIYESGHCGEPVSLKVYRRMIADMTRTRTETANRYRARGL